MPVGVCAFDLDDTLTCGDPLRAAATCLDHGYEIAINTARPVPWLDDELKALNVLPLPGSPAFVHNPSSYRQTLHEVAETKARAMDHIAAHFGTSNVVLFDDRPENVDAVRRRGYRAQLVSAHGTCGVSEEDLKAALGH